MDKVKIGLPIEYEDENNIVRNGLFLREPEIKELEKRLKEINKITDLKQQCKKQKEVIDKAINDIQEIIDAVNKNTIIAMKQFNFKLEIIQDELGGSNDILKEVSE